MPQGQDPVTCDNPKIRATKQEDKMPLFYIGRLVHERACYFMWTTRDFVICNISNSPQFNYMIFRIFNCIGSSPRNTISRVLEPLHTTSEELKKDVSLWKHIKCFSSTLCRGNLKTRQSPFIVDLCLSKTRSRKSRDYPDVTVCEKLRFQNVLRPHENVNPAFSNFSGLKSAFEKPRFRDGLVWTVP